MNEEIKQYLETKFRELEAKILIQQKRVLNTDEAAQYIGISKYTLYQMTSKSEVQPTTVAMIQKAANQVLFR